MHKFGILIIVVLLLVNVSACSMLASSSAKTSQSSSQTKNPGYHIVRKGETLYSIAWYYGKDYRSVAIWNTIDYPYLIKPGQYVYLHPRRSTPKMSASSQSRYSASTGPRRNTRTASKIPKTKTSSAKTYTAKSNSGSKPKSKSSSSGKGKSSRSRAPSWRWPTSGKVVEKYSFGRGKKGIVVKGRTGQKILAAASGQVVYTGSGLQGYGKLIIIKHNDTFLSAYAHNKNIRVKEEEKVKRGQHIADMGKSGTNISSLHFEIRRNGKPVDPLRYLPKQ